ncbi:MAG: sortase [Anaerolineales bacterium]|nr:sortase [Anaerolineales bacterium]
MNAAASGDTINIPAACTITLTGANGEDANASGDLDFTKSLNIVGADAGSTIIDGDNIERIFHNTGAFTVNISSVTIRNGRGGIVNPYTGIMTVTNSTLSGNQAVGSSGGGIHNGGTLTVMNSTFFGNQGFSGGGIYNWGTLTVTNSSFSSNQAYPSNGGGIRNSGNLTVTNSTFSSNQADTYGGGIQNGGIHDGGTLHVQNSTFSGNYAKSSGGGISNWFGTLTVKNSTFSGNRAPHGGGIYNYSYMGTVSATNSTFSGNQASVGGGIFGIATLSNTIVANSVSGGDCSPGGTSSITAEAYNFDTDGSCGNATQKTIAEINLGQLADNGGPTQTMALLSGSHAIDVGNAAICLGIGNVDQRGVNRPQGAGCDIGAYEFGPVIPAVTTSTPTTNAILTSLSSIFVTFNQDMVGDASANGAQNINNYLLVERGSDKAFNTQSCKAGLAGDDIKQTISNASYNNATMNSTLTLASSLIDGTYRLFVCGTTSIWSVAGLELNNGISDFIIDFTISTAVSGGDGEAISLPHTGFAPKVVTQLLNQPTELAYRALGDIWLEIPALNVNANIVGVPKLNNTWDVDWLGNEVGWLNGTAFPTWEGNSALTAHVTNADGLPGPFVNIKSLAYGDQIIVHLYGEQYIFEVRKTLLVRPGTTDYALQHLEDNSFLTLITCQGYNEKNNSYRFRRIVRAVLIEVRDE